MLPPWMIEQLERERREREERERGERRIELEIHPPERAPERPVPAQESRVVTLELC